MSEPDACRTMFLRAPFRARTDFIYTVPEAAHKVLASGYLLLALSEQKKQIA